MICSPAVGAAGAVAASVGAAGAVAASVGAGDIAGAGVAVREAGDTGRLASGELQAAVEAARTYARPLRRNDRREC